MYPNRQAFKTMVGHSEGTCTSPATVADGYDVIVTGIDGVHEVFADYAWHPFAIGTDAAKWRAPKVINHAVPPLESTASGRYQILRRYWLIYSRQLGLRDFGREAQDAYFDQQLRERRALALVDGGYFDAAVRAVAGLWASMPGPANEGQTQRPLERLRQFYLNAGGNIAS